MSEAAEEKKEQEAEGEIIEAGYVGELRELPFHEARHRAETARRLAFFLVEIMATTFGLHYVTTAVLAARKEVDAVESLAKIFNIWLPVVASLVSAAATYYFTRDRS